MTRAEDAEDTLYDIDLNCHEEGILGGEVRVRTDYYLHKRDETHTASYGTVTDRDCPDCGSLMLFFPHIGDDICPECGCWLTTGVPEFVEQAAETMGEDPEKYVDEVNTK